MSSLIVRREALIRTLEARYAKYPTLEIASKTIYPLYWGEPSRFEHHLGITPLESEEYESSVPNVMFSTEQALGYLGLGKRKAHSKIIKTEIEPWGTAEEVLQLYKE